MTRIKIVGNFGGGNLNEYFERLTKGGGEWNDLKLVETGEDRLVVINWTAGDIPPDSIVFQMEPRASVERFPGIFSDLAANRDKVGVAYDSATFRNSIEWHVSPTWSEFKEGSPDLTKSKELSTVMSSTRKLPGHRSRLRLLCKLCDDRPVDVWGFGHAESWIDPASPSAGREMGPLPFREKDAGLFPYKYTFAAENTVEPNYFTEKIVDAILAECLCFYVGCPNLYQWLDPRAFIPITAVDPAHSLSVIESAIASNEWERRLPYIREAKKAILDELQIFPTLERLIGG